MIYYAIGFLVFGMYILYDVNSVLWNHRVLHASFLGGSVLLAGATVWQTVEVMRSGTTGWYTWLFLVPAVFFLALLIYTLFFALPFEATYLQSDSGKAVVYDCGMYALCRHPGVLWFFLFYLCLGAAFYPSGILRTGLFYSVLNVGYIVFQDCWTFPHIFEDYGRYKETTPFLIPGRSSVLKMIRTWK